MKLTKLEVWKIILEYKKENIRNLSRSNRRFLNKRCKNTDEHILAIKCFIDENSNNIYSLADVKAYFDKFETLF